VFYYDAHNHLCDPRLESFQGDLLEALSRFPLRAAVVNSSGEEEWGAISKLADTFSWVIPAFGIHPWNAGQSLSGWRERLIRLLDSHPKATMGEIGLDRWIQNHDIALQRDTFEWQLSLAAQRSLPVSIHCLKAWGLLLEVLQSNALPQCGFLLHSYSGPEEMISQFTKLGAYFSFSPYFLHERKVAQRDVFTKITMDRLLVETDAPDMWPPEERNAHPLCERGTGKPLNHPLNIEVAYAGLAEARGLSVEALGKSVEANFWRLFGNTGNTGSDGEGSDEKQGCGPAKECGTEDQRHGFT